MGIPNKFNRLGTNTSIFPDGYLAAEFLESTGEQYVLTEIHPERLNAKAKWQTFLQTGRLFCYDNGSHFYRAIQSIAETGAMNYLGVDALVDGKRFFVDVQVSAGSIVEAEINSDENFISNNGTIKRPSSGTIAVGYNANAKLTLFAATNKSNKIKARLYALKFWRADGNVADFAFAVDKQGVPCLFDKVTRKPFYNDSGAGQFIVGMTIEQARNLGKLPVVETGTLTVSLPWEAQWDEGVQFALPLAMIKGWTIVVQYRDPEIATANIPIGFLESTGTQYIDTEVLSGALSFDAVVRGCAGSSCCVIGGRMNDSYGNNILGSSGRKGWQFVYNSWLQTGALTYQPLKKYHVQSILGTLLVDGVVASKTGNGNFSYSYSLFAFANNRNNEEVTLLTSMQMWYLTIKDNLNTSVRTFVPVLDTSGVPCMYDKVTQQPFYNSGTGSFIAGFNTAEQSRKLATLPDVTAETDETKKSLTVSLPWEAQLVSTIVPAALQIAANRGWTITVQYREPEADNAYYNKYSACTTTAEVAAVNADYMNDLTAEGEWIYPLDALTNGYMMFYNGSLRGAQSFYLPKLTAGNDMFANNSGESLITEIEIDAPIATNLRELFLSNNKSALSKVTLLAPNNKNWLRLCLRNPNLAEFWSDAENLVDASDAFSGCVLNKESVLRICSVNLGETSSGSITLGIHTDLQTDADVLAAIEATKAKGWTVTVQWNGTATAAAASTFGLRSPSIYAKLTTLDHPDGSVESLLDWGHYVTNWEENGYQEFSSIEEAEEYFNINQIEEV